MRLLKHLGDMFMNLKLVIFLLSMVLSLTSAEINFNHFNPYAHAFSEVCDNALPQSSIAKMYAFIEHNQAGNPFNTRPGVTFFEAINTLDWGEGVTIWPVMEGHQAPEGMVWGSIFMRLNVIEDDFGISSYDDDYMFFDLGLFINQNSFDDNNTYIYLPQTGLFTINAPLYGIIMITSGILFITIDKKLNP